MEKRTNYRLKLLLLICGFVGLAVLPFAASYSQATISNPASVKITDPANALIAVQLASQEVCFPGDTIQGNVVNNLGVPLTRLKATNATFLSSFLSVGATTSFSFSAPATSGLYDGEIQAEWGNGSAKVPYSITLDVIDPNDLLVVWDQDKAEIITTNGSSHSLGVIVGNMSRTLQGGESAAFQRTGESTHVTFSLENQRDYISVSSLGEQRNYSVSIATQLPPPPEPEVPETPLEEEPPANPSEDMSSKEAILEEQEAISEDDDKLQDSGIETTEAIIEP